MDPALTAPPAPDRIRGLLALAAGLWVGYVILLLGIDGLLNPQHRPVWPYYALNLTAGGVILALLGWTGARAGLGRAFLPGVIGLLTVLPIVGTDLVLPSLLPRPLPLGLLISPESLAFRVLPALLLALVLTAWAYGWRPAVGVSLGCAALSAACLLFVAATPPTLPGAPLLGGSPPGPGLVVFTELLAVGIQTLCLLICSYFVSTVMRWLRDQQAAVAAANRQLRQHAVALESLTISRERNRVARELHDTLAHTLSGLTVQLETVAAYWSVDPDQAQGLLAKAAETARTGLQESRHALTALRASPLEDLGLALALRQLAEAAAARGGLQLDLTLADPLPLLPPDVEQGLYRVAQEAIANVIYHANARRLAVAFDRAARLTVRDDGVGFALTAAGWPGHFGLAGMQERAHLIGGELCVTSQPGAGTTVELRLPCGGPAA